MTAPSTTPAARAGRCFLNGGRAGLRTTVWLLKFMIPVSAAVTALSWTGALAWMAQWIAPAFRWFGLPGEAAIAFVTGAALNVYSGIAAMSVIPLDGRQITILAIMVLISHNLPIEVMVQYKTGTSGLRMLALRLAMSVAGGLLLNWVLPAGDGAQSVVAAATAPAGDWGALMIGWVKSTAWLVVKIALFATGVMVLQRFLDEFGLMAWLARVLAPPLALLGLPRNTVFLWIVANTLGLAYGAGVIIEETKLGKLTRDETEILNHSVAVCHSLLEDSLLFIAVGAWAFWITVPRVLLAAAAVWSYRAWAHLRRPAASHV
jgi:spore maturation protein SpmB